MSRTVISVENLSKRYRIGYLAPTEQKFASSLRDVVLGPLFQLPRLLNPFYRSQRAQVEERFIWALKDVSFDVKQGQGFGVIGRNGAGKSTLLKIISRITAPTSGRVRIAGRVASLLEVGTGFNQELTGRENVYLNGTVLGMDRREIDNKFDEIVAFSGVERFLDTQVKYYSSGMALRLAFSVAAHLEPETMIIDEVLAVGDMEFQRRCLEKIEQAGKEGRTMLFVSHTMSMVMNMCDRAILLVDGQVHRMGETSEVVQDYIAMNSLTESAERAWDEEERAPGNEELRLAYVKVTAGDSDTPTNNILIHQDVIIRIGYWNYKPGNRYVVNMILYDHNNNLVFGSANFPSASFAPDPWFGQDQPIGLYETVCRIPGNLLNDIPYYLTVFIGTTQGFTRGELIVKEDNLVSFTIHDSGSMRREFGGRWAGFMRPRLDWRTERLKETV